MTFDFSNLDRYEVTRDKVAKYIFYQLEGRPWLELAPANSANKPYHNSVLKRSSKNMRRAVSGSLDSEMMDEARDQDRELYPKFIIRGWGNVIDAKHEEVKFSKEACKAWLVQLPDWIFDEFRAFAGSHANFVDEPIGDIGELGKN